MIAHKKVLAKATIGAAFAAALTAGTALACAPPPAPPKAPPAPARAEASHPSLARLEAAQARLDAAVEELEAAVQARTAGIQARVEARTAAIQAAVEARVDRQDLQRIADARLSPEQIRAIREEAREAALEGARAAKEAQAMVAALQPHIDAVKAEAKELRRACLAGEIECTVTNDGESISIRNGVLIVGDGED